jgi:hypothetical protein
MGYFAAILVLQAGPFLEPCRVTTVWDLDAPERLRAENTQAATDLACEVCCGYVAGGQPITAIGNCSQTTKCYAMGLQFTYLQIRPRWSTGLAEPMRAGSENAA